MAATVVMALALAGVLAFIASSLPELKRYINMERM